MCYEYICDEGTPRKKKIGEDIICEVVIRYIVYIVDLSKGGVNNPRITYRA